MKKKGAEATLEIGEEKVTKKREKKDYRHPELDEKIRNERTDREKKIMKEARSSGANVPEVEKTDESTLEIEKIDGEPLKEVLEDSIFTMEDLGRNVASLHGNDILHGDLTTSNVMVVNRETFLIDFGLAFRSQRTEDRAVDIHLLKQVLESSHPGAAEDAWEEFLKGYQDYRESEKVLERLEEVERRGRYK